MDAWLVGGIPYGVIFIDEKQANTYAEAAEQKINKMKIWILPDVSVFIGTEIWFSPHSEEDIFIKMKPYKFNNVDGRYETCFENGYGKYRMRLIITADIPTIKKNIAPLEVYLKTLDLERIERYWLDEDKEYIKEVIGNINRLLHISGMKLD
jgi:hypothetical protein